MAENNNGNRYRVAGDDKNMGATNIAPNAGGQGGAMNRNEENQQG